MQFLLNANIDFVSKRKIGYILSGALILVGLVSLVLHGGPNYGIDFTGGTSLDLQFENTIDTGDLRNSISDIGFGSAVIKQVGLGAENTFIIRVEKQDEGVQAAQLIEAEFSKDFPDNAYDIRSVQEVGPKIGGELRRTAIMAVFISLLGILIYISYRFKFQFAVGAVAALFHDVLITLGIFSILQLEISLVVVAAFLTIVGYSLNDTIVVFDRIRENQKILRRESFSSITNISLNQTLSRTVITSFTTLLVVLVLYIVGGEVIHDFSFALLVGVIIGTYSSLFVASPIVLEWQIRSEAKGKGATHRKTR